MSTLATFYITTAIDYPNAEPHLGHAYEKVIADTLARYHRLKGEDVHFLTGTDENAQKVLEKAKEAGVEPHAFVEEKVKAFRALLAAWDITNDDFIRTTEKRHTEAAKAAFKKVFDKKLIYLGTYDGLYCKGCEKYITEKDLVDGKCPEHGTVPEQMKEDAYFFKMSAFSNRVLTLLEKTDFIRPASRKNEIIARIKEQGLKDLSVTRSTTDWGIVTPIDAKHVMYVWFDALLNYYTAVHEDAKRKKYWPPSVQVVGKDINWFHSVIWPSILYALDAKLPQKLLVHGFVNTPEGKMSKTTGNVVDPMKLVDAYPLDALRYFFLREGSLAQDIAFSEDALKKRHNDELANNLGNLVNRTLSMLEKYHAGKVPKSKCDPAFAKKLDVKKVCAHMDAFELHLALEKIFAFVSEANKFVNEQQPWAQKDKERAVTLYTLADAVRISAILLSPFIPETCEKIFTMLGVKEKDRSLKCAKFNGLKAGTKTKKGEILFRKIE